MSFQIDAETTLRAAGAATVDREHATAGGS